MSVVLLALGRKDQNDFFSGERSKWARVARSKRRKQMYGTWMQRQTGVFRNGSDWAERFDSIHP